MSSFNLSAFNFIYGFSHRNILLDGAGIFFAQYLAYFLVLGFLILVFGQKGLCRKIYFFCEGTLAVILARGIITEIIRFFYYHPRPFDVLGFTPLISEPGTSFPSAHMAWFFALAMAVWFADRKWGLFYLVLTTVMGIARIYVGVHWPLDIVSGVLIGILSAAFIHWILRESRKKMDKRHSGTG